MERFQTQQIETEDGVSLRVFDAQPEVKDPPVLVLSNGLGGNLQTWRHLIDRFGPTHRIVSWDYRGLYGSAFTEPQKQKGVSVEVPVHAADLVQVLDHFEIHKAVFVGWSMGVQLNFELARTHLDRIEGIVAMSGGFGQTLTHTIGGKSAEKVIRPSIHVYQEIMDRFGELFIASGRGRKMLKVAKRLGMVSRHVDDEVFYGLIHDYVQLDFEIYCKILERLGDHDAHSVLPSIVVPALVITGDRDPMTPPSVSRRMARILPNAELMLLPGGTHYVPVEYPELINARVAKFLKVKIGQKIQLL